MTAAADLLTARTEANRAFFAAEADNIARLCHEMSERFLRGGRLLAIGEADVDSRYKAMVFEFSRTLSRLTEMQTREYMMSARLPPR